MPKLAMKLQEAVNNRKVIYGLRDAFEKYCDSFDERCDSGEVGVRLQSLEKLKKDFDIIQRQIDQMDAENLDEHIAQRVTFESSFFKIKGFLLSKLPSQINQSPLMNSTMFQNPSSVSGFHLRLPQIDLPKFDGDFSKWLSFRDTFSSMVHLNPEIPTVAKLQYLLQSWQGDARKPFETVDVLADNYESTWDAIIKRFDNRRFLKRQLFRAIYDLQPIKKECPQELNSLAGNFERHVKALAKLGEPVEFWDTPLVNLFSYKLDPVTLRAWEEKTSEQEEVKFDEMMAFIYQRVRVLNSVLPENQQGIKVAGNKPFRRLAVAVAAKPGSILDTNNPFPLCVVCPERHYLYKCPTFERMSVRQRRELISQKRLCWNCFRSGHMARNCASKFTCRHCREHHHSMLHEDLSQPNRLPPQPIPEESIPSTSTPSTSTPSTSTPSTSNPQVSLSVQSTNSTVLLETVSLVVIDGFGRKVPARALLDSASMCNFMTKRLANTLNLRRRKVDVAVSGIGDSMKQIKCKLTATIRSNTSPFESPLEFLILKKPTVSLPTAPVDIAKWELPDVILADPLFHIPNDVDLIVGGEMFYEIHTGRKIQLSDNPLFVIETAFGWTVSGKAPVQSEVTPHVCHLTTVDRNLERALQKFWELESVPECSKLTPEEEQCEKKYCATTTRDSSGRYTVRLPLTRDPLVCLGESRSIAERRFLNLEKRLDRDPGTREAYYQFMDDYIRLQHMIKLETVDDSVPHCYLPHHPVFKDTSTTTKVRVVFDASCKTTSGFSINDLQLVGPVIQDDLLSIVLRFRKHPIAMVADIEKMYRQIQLHPDDCPYQRILWRQHAEDQIATYELQTVTYGLASAPFLATRTLKQAAIDEEARYPIAAVVFREDFYMDDCLTGSQSITEAVRLREEATALSVAAGFPLKKWASNVPEALAGVSEEDLAINPIHDLQDNQTVSTLGLVWETVTDLLRFRVQLPSPDPVLTKRKIMSYIAQIFDPLGLVGPIITVAKLIMQSLWALKTEGDNAYEWDRPLPESLQATWRQFHSTLSIISKIRVPRFVSLPKANSLQLHFFSDASEKAYGSCCYLRTESADSVRVRLLTSKSKVAPLSSHHTIARLELCGAVLSTSLYEKVSRALKISAETCFRNKPTLVQQSMADLPASRVVQDRPFAICGVDYCGPLYLKSPIRNRAPTKAYLAIFVCFITRAVHLELVSDLSTSAFVAALRRFVARRSKPREIHSDNGTQFKGTSNELRRVYEMLKTSTADRKKIFQWCSESEIQWKFIPPRSPHFGGLWEAAVKSAKHHLLREIGHTNVYYEDMLTLLAEIEMCLNSRPLVEIPVEVKDLEALTPGHFLVGENMQAVACKPLTEVPDNLLSHWDLTQKRFQRIWSRWQREYLQQLQARAVKPKQKVEIQPGRLVIVKEDQLPPIQWPLGRITEVVPGSDGVDVWCIDSTEQQLSNKRRLQEFTSVSEAVQFKPGTSLQVSWLGHQTTAADSRCERTKAQ
ncbi:uncharacterized protein LOC129741527 [Uranotaenia lowii]|uniref:uncharacterized protein LOC129741527 n=1 Tax=Uranotaenia lowii TaxID=190385 RepID=UPI0024788063|nr:uncharacterized protein LOC129741527 [Uranotaenia lowii]